MAPSKGNYFYLTIVRHAQTNENQAQIIQGHLDTMLTPAGENQAKDVGTSLKHLQIDGIFSSDLKRASCTAEIIKRSYERSPVTLATNSLMRERNFGLNSGKPRSQLHEFIAQTKLNRTGCQMWRDNQGECGHQIFWRALNFFFDLCEVVVNQHTKPVPIFPLIGSLEMPPNAAPPPILLPLRQPPVPCAFASPNPHQSECMDYNGHFVLVSHGQWIREFNHILYALPQRSLGFPPHHRMLAVLGNCQFNQVGVAIHYDQLTECAARLRAAVETAIRGQHRRNHPCPYELGGLVDRLPIDTVCYHVRVDPHSVQGSTTNGPTVAPAEPGPSQKHPVFSGVERLYFAKEDDEYAGLPLDK